MTRPTDLVQIISSILSVPAATVELHSRNLREAGLRSKSPRGRGAGGVTPRDATNLLLAVVGSRNVKDSVASVERPGGLVSPAGQWKTDFITIPELEALPPQHSFADALEALIASAASGALQHAAEELEQGAVDLMRDSAPSLNIEVSVYGPTPRGAIMIEEIVIADDDRQYRYKDNVDRHFYGDRPTGLGSGNLAWLDISRPAEMDSDLRTSATFSHRTIAAIGQLLASK